MSVLLGRTAYIRIYTFAKYLSDLLLMNFYLSLFLPIAEPLPLMDLCRRSVRVALGRERLSEIHGLPLPASLKNYLLYQ